MCDPTWLATGEGSPVGRAIGLSNEAIEIAKLFDAITDPDQRNRAAAITRLVMMGQAPVVLNEFAINDVQTR